MIQRENPTRLCADVGTLRAAISPIPALHQIYDGEIESRSAMTCRETNPIALPGVTQSFDLLFWRCSRKPQSP